MLQPQLVPTFRCTAGSESIYQEAGMAASPKACLVWK